MKTNADLTIYNKYIVSGAEKWQRTLIVGVTWENRKAANTMRVGLIEADQATVYIPLARGINYLTPKAWQALTVKTNKWTIQVGDYIVKELVSDEISVVFTMTMLKAKYDDVLQIKTVDTMDIGSISMRHWQIGAQ